jgi:hypothetical protein
MKWRAVFLVVMTLVPMGEIVTHIQGASYLPPTPTPITLTPEPPQPITISANLVSNPYFAADDFGLAENWSQTGVTLNRWYLVQGVLPGERDARWVDRVDLSEEGKEYALRSTDGQTCHSFCSTEAFQIVPAEANTFYTLAAAARIEEGDGPSLYMDFLDASKMRIEVATVGGYTDQWSRQIVAATSPAGTRFIRVILYTSNAATGTIYWDDVEMHSLSKALSPLPLEGINVAAEKPVIARAGGVTYEPWGHANDAADYNTTTNPRGGRWGIETNTGGGTFEVVDLGAAYELVGVGYATGWDGAFANPLTFQVEVSLDNVNWTPVSIVIHQPGGSTTYCNVDFPIKPTAARYVKYWMPPDGEWNGWGDFIHLRAYSLTGRSIKLTPTPPPGPRTPTPITPSPATSAIHLT